MVLVNRKNFAPKIAYKEKWRDAEWTEIQGVEPVEVIDASASHDLPTASFRYRYGDVQRPGQTDYQRVAPLDIKDYWIRWQYNFGTSEDPDFQTIFIGKVWEENRESFARTYEGDLATGLQTFNCAGPYELLRRRSVSRSFWKTDNDIEEIKWLPPMNMTDDRNAIVGNRSSSVQTGNVFVYSEDGSTWTSRDYAEYILEKFMHSTNPDDPPWLVHGDPDTLQDINRYTNSFEFEEITNVADILHTIIPRSAGFEWFIKYTTGEGGTEQFTIYIYSLAKADVTTDSVTLHANPNIATFDMVGNPDLVGAQVAIATSQKYSKIRLVGNRVVVCASYQQTLVPADNKLDNGWTASQVIDYEEAAGRQTSFFGADKINDVYRATDRFRDVFQRFVVKESANFDASLIPSVTRFGRESFSVRGASQDLVKETLAWTPLRQGYDYATDPPTAIGDTDSENPFLPPAVYIQEGSDPAANEPYLTAEWAGVGVSPLPTEWGVQLHAYPNHALAAGRALSLVTYPSETDPVYSTQNITITIAFRSDERLTVEHELVSSPNPPNSEGVYEMAMPDAEMWLLCPNTVYALDESGAQLTSPSAGVVLRSDRDRMNQALTGAVARYQNDRYRATVRVKGIWNWAEGIGYLLKFASDGSLDPDPTEEDATDNRLAPITYIRWSFEGDHTTELKTGFAL